MAKIWYSVFGEGYGHATRSAPIIRHLQKKHKLLITGFNKSYVYLKKRFPKITHKIEGPSFVHEDNEIKILETVFKSLNSFPSQSRKNIIHSFNLIKKFKPDLIISDFEPTSHYFAYFLKIPIINIDNMNVIARCNVDVKKEDLKDYFECITVIGLFNPKSNYHLILTLKNFKKKKKNVFLFPPVLREEILKIEPKKQDFYLIYQTSKTNYKLIRELKKIKENFIFYGMDKSSKEKNIIFKKFSKNGFIKDLSNCKGVIMTGGFTTISEAIYLKKPMLIVPSENQYEQKFNGLTIQDMKIGICVENINGKSINSFIKNIDFYEKNINKIKKWDNSKILKKLEELITELKSKPKPIFKFVIKVEDLLSIPEHERTLTILKPDAIEKNITGDIIKRLEKKGINPVGIKMTKMNKNQAKRFYKHLKNKIPKSVFDSLIKYMTSKKIILIVWQGNGVVKKVREICGPTDPKKAKKYNIRSLSNEDLEMKFKKGKAVKNIIHSSASIQEAKKEIKFFFWPWEIHKL